MFHLLYLICMSREFRDPLASSADRAGESDTPNSNRLFNRSAVYGALSSGTQDSSVDDAVQFFTGALFCLLDISSVAVQLSTSTLRAV
jgi:hypothetical protein